MRPLHLHGRLLISHLQGSGLEAERGRGAGELARPVQCLLGKREDNSLGSQNPCKKPKAGQSGNCVCSLSKQKAKSLQSWLARQDGTRKLSSLRPQLSHMESNRGRLLLQLCTATRDISTMTHVPNNNRAGSQAVRGESHFFIYEELRCCFIVAQDAPE